MESSSAGGSGSSSAADSLISGCEVSGFDSSGAEIIACRRLLQSTLISAGNTASFAASSGPSSSVVEITGSKSSDVSPTGVISSWISNIRASSARRLDTASVATVFDSSVNSSSRSCQSASAANSLEENDSGGSIVLGKSAGASGG